MSFAEKVAEKSYCKRLQVGAVIVKGDSIWFGYNGTAKGEENCCEDENNVTKGDVVHAELNALLKVTRSTQSSQGAVLYVTHSPCMACTSALINAEFSKVFYKHAYRDPTPLKRLIAAGIEVVQYGT